MMMRKRYPERYENEINYLKQKENILYNEKKILFESYVAGNTGKYRVFLGKRRRLGWQRID